MINLMYITNKPQIAKIVEKAGINIIFIDLEYIGKEQRQKNLDTVKSKHCIEDIGKVKKVISEAKLLVRVNPIYDNSKFEINAAINNGADYIMLPMYRTIDEVKKFINYVDGRCKAVLLLETIKAMEILDETLLFKEVDCIYVGLNDLHLEMDKKFMFEVLAEGIIDEISRKVKKAKKKFGFGGISRIGSGTLPAERILKEHYRLESEYVIISRSFCREDNENIKQIFDEEIQNIRNYEKKIEKMEKKDLIINHEEVKTIVKKIVEKS